MHPGEGRVVVGTQAVDLVDHAGVITGAGDRLDVGGAVDGADQLVAGDRGRHRAQPGVQHAELPGQAHGEVDPER